MYRTKEAQKEGCILRSARVRPPLFHPIFPRLLLWGRQSNCPPDLGIPKEGQSRGGCLIVLEEHPDGRRLRIFPPACLSDALLHHFALREPGPALEEVAAGLPFSAAPAFPLDSTVQIVLSLSFHLFAVWRASPFSFIICLGKRLNLPHSCSSTLWPAQRRVAVRSRW